MLRAIVFLLRHGFYCHLGKKGHWSWTEILYQLCVENIRDSVRFFLSNNRHIMYENIKMVYIQSKCCNHLFTSYYDDIHDTKRVLLYWSFGGTTGHLRILHTKCQFTELWWLFVDGMKKLFDKSLRWFRVPLHMYNHFIYLWNIP